MQMIMEMIIQRNNDNDDFLTDSIDKRRQTLLKNSAADRESAGGVAV